MNLLIKAEGDYRFYSRLVRWSSPLAHGTYLGKNICDFEIADTQSTASITHGLHAFSSTPVP